MFLLVSTVQGYYCIVAYLPGDCEIEVGKLGTFQFPSGFYVYTGSGLSSLEGRIGRHLGMDKKRKWHIDYFLEKAAPVAFLPVVSSDQTECEINSMFLKKGEVVAEGFGSSDCKCPSHLVFVGDYPHLE
ncbi:MAG: GIY-YIG nuclease family protein [Methanobacteriota archaeon]|nr:MAG: GIY-YIG nuclease family protein [Euryarchaeota archaeon]